MVGLELQAVRRDRVPEILATRHGLRKVKIEILFFPAAKKIVQDADAVMGRTVSYTHLDVYKETDPTQYGGSKCYDKAKNS